jgi:hypothetical protein
LFGETLLNVNGIVPATGIPPSNEKVYGPVPLAEVMMIDPLLTPEQAVAVVEVVAVIPGPTPTVSMIGVVAQLVLRSVTIIVWLP